ncbi:hypothetical protein INR49_032075 [Caranx melampygus]|nr:hypothetical protein INR49_032075 [Caranx melampygus]
MIGDSARPPLVLTSGSLDVQNGSQCAEGSGPVTEGFLDPKDKTSLSTVPGNLQPCPVKAAVAIITQDAPSVNGKKPEVGGNSKPASQEISKIGGFRQPITVKTGVPVLRSQPIRIKIVVPPRCKRPITNSAISLTKDFARSHFRRPVLVSAGAVITEKNRSKIQIPAVKTEGEDTTQTKTEESKAVSFHGTEVETGDAMCKERDVLDMPQVQASTSEDPQSGQADSAEVDGEGSSQAADPSLSQSLDNALNAPSDDLYPSPAPAADSPSPGVDQTKAPDVLMSLVTNSDPSKAAEPNIKAVQEANAVVSPPSGISVPSQSIQIIANPPTSAPILLLSSPSPSPQLSSTPTSPGASTPMFLLLSSVPSSSGDSAATSTPIAVLDPSTGQLSQITAASAPVSLPLSSAQPSTVGPPLPTLSHPVIRLSASDPPVILSGVNNVNSGSVLTSLAVPSSTPALQSDHSITPIIQTQISSSDSNRESASLTYEPSTQPSPEAEAQSPASEPKFDPSDLHSEHLPLDDHLYFSNTAAPPSPPIGPILPSGKLDPLDPLDPLSPAASPNTMGSRRVLYCQLCPRVFFYLSDLERHAITHSQKKPHVCQQCGKAFKRSSHLQRHKHIHTGQRNFVCPICAKRFREAGELQRHQRVHTGEKPYQCQLCHTRFAERNTLRRHTKRKHPYHQVAMEMLNERRDRGGGGVSGVQEEEESAEWYNSTVSNLENSESEMET